MFPPLFISCLPICLSIKWILSINSQRISSLIILINRMGQVNGCTDTHKHTSSNSQSGNKDTGYVKRFLNLFQNIHMKCHIDNNFRCCNINIFYEMMNVEEYIKDLRTNN